MYAAPTIFIVKDNNRRVARIAIFGIFLLSKDSISSLIVTAPPQTVIKQLLQPEICLRWYMFSKESSQPTLYMTIVKDENEVRYNAYDATDWYCNHNTIQEKYEL